MTNTTLISKTLNLLNKILFYLIDTILLFLFSFTSLPHRKDNLLIIRLDNIGDFLLWINTITDLVQNYESYHTTLVINKNVSDLASLYSYFDVVLPIDIEKFKRDIFYHIETVKIIRQTHPTVAIHPTYSREFSPGDSLVRISGAKTKIGSFGDTCRIHPYEKFVANRWYTDLVPVSQQPLMELLRNTEFVNNLNSTEITPHFANIPKQKSPITPCPIQKPYFIIFPGASIAERMWPTECFARCASKVHNQFGLDLIVCGLTSEHKIAEKVIKLSGINNATNMAGKTSLPTFCELIRNASLLITNETSAAHIAPAVKTPSVCILGGGHFGRFLPYPNWLTTNRSISVYNHMDCYGCNWKCSLKHEMGDPYPCIKKISVSNVYSATQKLLSETHDP